MWLGHIGCKQVVVKDAISSSISNQQFVMEEPIKDVIFVEAFQIMHKWFQWGKPHESK